MGSSSHISMWLLQWFSLAALLTCSYISLFVPQLSVQKITNQRNIYECLCIYCMFILIHVREFVQAGTASDTSQLRSLYFTESLWRPLNVKRAVKCPRGHTCLPVSACLSHCLQCHELGQTLSTFIDFKPLLRVVDSRATKITLEGVMAVINCD